jgi:hypothetical protein
MEFKKVSDRLSFFFSLHSWALLVDMPSDGSLDKHLQGIRTACKHWGSKLEFPFQFNATAFENNLESEEYWRGKIPRLRLLHSRKQDIILSELFEGYDPKQANQLLRRKMRLDQNAWAHLIYFGGPRCTFSCTFQTMPEPQELRNAVVHFHENHIAETNLESSEEQSPQAIDFGVQHGMSNLNTLNTQILLGANNSASALRLNQSASNSYPIPISINYFNCSIEFQYCDIEVKLTPTCFAIYCMYLKVSEGFTNKQRVSYKLFAKNAYLNILGRDELSIDLSALNNCFDLRDDKPFRDAVYKIKREIIRALGDTDLARQYYVTGSNGGLKRICIPQEFVNNLRE